MKKFYSALAMAVAVSFSASAATEMVSRVDLSKAEAMTCTNEVSAIELPASMKKVGSVNRVKPTKMEELVGDYVYSYLSAIKDLPDADGVACAIEQVAADSISISGVLRYGSLKAHVDFAKGIITIPQRQVIYYNTSFNENIVLNTQTYYAKSDGKLYWGNYNEVPFQFVINEDGTLTPVEYTIKFEDGTPAQDKNGNIVKRNYYLVLTQTESEALTSTSCFDAFLGLTMAYKPWENISQKGWTTVGQATLMDAWVRNAFKNPDAFPALDCAVQKCDTIPTLYRLYDPYKKTTELWAGNQFEFNVSKTDGSIVFDLSYPACVPFMPKVYSGLEDNPDPEIGMGLGRVYCYNVEGTYYWGGQDYDLETIHDALLDDEDMNITKISNYDEKTHVVNIHNALFGIGSAPMAGYSWMNADKTPVDMSGMIVLPEDLSGIDNVIVDSNNSKAEYFNLQGVKVENPANGVFIRRQGKQVSKVYVR